MKKYIVLVVCLFAVSTVHAILIYDVIWENPPHVVGEAPTYGDGADRPDADGWNVVIRDNVDGFDGSVAVLTGINDAIMWFSAYMMDDVSYTSGIHTISWMSSVLEWNNSGNFVQAINMGDRSIYAEYRSTVDGMYLDVNMYVDGGYVQNKSINWSEGDVFDFVATFNLDEQWLNFSINGNPIFDGLDLSTVDVNLTGLSFQRYPFGGSAGELAIDNIRWEYTPKAIPEPATMGLLLLGSGLLAAKRKKIAVLLP